jgi:hypothetical protein
VLHDIFDKQIGFSDCLAQSVDRLVTLFNMRRLSNIVKSVAETSAQWYKNHVKIPMLPVKTINVRLNHEYILHML